MRNDWRLTNKEMGEAFGGYDFMTTDMRNVCNSQAKKLVERIEEFSLMPVSLGIEISRTAWQALRNEVLEEK